MSGAATVHQLEVVKDVDPLADILAALGAAPRLRTQEVLQRLTRDREWKNGDLKEFLEGFDAEPHKSEGVMAVDRKKVVDALASRDAA